MTTSIPTPPNESDDATASAPDASRSPDRPGVNDPGPGRRLALDIGLARIGVAVSDSMAMLATPVETIRRTTPKDPAGADGDDIARILALVGELRPVEIVIGLPRNLKNRGSSSAVDAAVMGDRLARRLDATGGRPPVIRYADERLTTVAAQRALTVCGVNQKKGRSVIDQAAAVEILQQWLDARARLVEPRLPPTGVGS